jgi:hypothetical protein
MDASDLVDPRLDLLVLMRAGSHLYGTAMAASDLDLKGVYLPTAEEILLQRVRPNIGQGPAKGEGSRNRAGDVDVEIFSLDRYLALLAAGQTIALDMLFAPDAVLLRPPAPLWSELRANAHRLVTRRAGGFLSYAKRQAALFGIKGSRLAGARKALELLDAAVARHGGTAKLAMAAFELQALAAREEHVAVVDLPTASGGTLRHLDLGGRKVLFSASLARARDLAAHVVASYGRRALEAERNEGVDWKALSHAVRVGRQALELLTTGRIGFPLACAPHLLAIKRGELDYETVAAEIEALVADIETAAASSALPEEPDRGFIDEVLLAAHGGKVRAWLAARAAPGRPS